MSVSTSRNGSRPDPEPRGERVDSIADLALRKSAAFDEFTRWLGAEIGAEWSTAMAPEWVVGMLRSNLRGRLAESRALREGRDGNGRARPWLRRSGW